MKDVAKYTLLLILSFCSMVSVGQEYRTIDGHNNNRSNPTLGTSEGQVARLTELNFADRVSAPGALDRPNPRHISNAIFEQQQSIPESRKHSDYIWVFGQFVDHDITLIGTNAGEPLPILVPECDEYFDPFCTGQSIIPVNRSAAREGSGTSVDNPREYTNEITSFIDASNVYGSDIERANYLRTFEDGLLRTSQGDLLPLNTIDGEFNSGRDFFAPHMEVNNPTTSKVFVAGDVRANENVLLTSMHTLFVREHNYQARLLKETHPFWSDETLYQEAKLRTTAIIQAITFEEWLPALGIEIPEYQGYVESVDPSILKVFSVAAFRFGHTMLNSNLKRIMPNCDPHPNGDITLAQAFFNPTMILQDGGIDPLLRGMAAQDMQEVDGRLVDDVRNLLFGPPGSGIGMDLASINIQRGREMGLPDFNTVRQTFGLPRYSDINEICRDNSVTSGLTDMYDSVDDIDPWVGMLCEEHMDESMFGRTITEILKYQFSALRDGDRFYYENEPLLTDEEKATIKSTRLADVLKRNTELRLMQDNVFKTEEDCQQDIIVLEELMLDAVLYPNPVSTDFAEVAVFSTLDDAPMNMYISDNLGRVVQQQEFVLEHGMNIIEFPVATLHAGTYILVMQSGAAKNQQQFIRL